MINYTSCPIIPPNVKAIGRTTSQELHSQSEAGRRGQTEKLYAPILPIVCRALKKKKKKNFQQIYRSYALEEQKTYKGHFY